MAGGLERELKCRLDAAAHGQLAAALLAAFGPPRHLAQRNRFYDTAEQHLRRAGCSLRLRHEAGRAVATCKVYGGVAAGGLHTAMEHDLPVHTVAWAFLESAPDCDPATCLPIPAPALAAAAGAPLRLLGGFDNLRLEWRRPGELVCLDATDLGRGRTDYEIEIETEDPATSEPAWRARLASLGLTWEAQPLTKLGRYVAWVGA
jgi:uncharacterized protein YjbK